eukprot:3442478-Prymnesium_polylepis.1
MRVGPERDQRDGQRVPQLERHLVGRAARLCRGVHGDLPGGGDGDGPGGPGDLLEDDLGARVHLVDLERREEPAPQRAGSVQEGVDCAVEGGPDGKVFDKPLADPAELRQCGDGSEGRVGVPAEHDDAERGDDGQKDEGVENIEHDVRDKNATRSARVLRRGAQRERENSAKIAVCPRAVCFTVYTCTVHVVQYRIKTKKGKLFKPCAP